jgi:RNA polymerase-binding transcription factor DksA
MADNSVIRYSDEELAEFKELIDKKLAKAKNELEFMKEQIVELNENTSDHQGGNWFDDSSLHLELEMLNNSVMRQQQFIQNLENALIRIKNKTYGICTITGQLIEKKRLQLVPHATKSVAAKDMSNTPELSIAPRGTGASEIISDEDTEEGEAPKKPVKKERKVITKIKKKTNPTSAPKKVDLDLEDDDWTDNEEEGDDYGDDINNIDFDNIADED